MTMATLTTANIEMIAKVQSEAGNSVTNLLESNIPLILADLGKALKESDEDDATIPVKIKLIINTHDGIRHNIGTAYIIIKIVIHCIGFKRFRYFSTRLHCPVLAASFQTICRTGNQEEENTQRTQDSL